MTTTREYTHLELEAALCVWEDMCDRIHDPHAIQHYNGLYNAYVQSGTFSMRHASIPIGQWCLKVHDLIDRDLLYGLSYDWEVIPAMLDQVSWSPGGYPEMPDPAVAAPLVAAALAKAEGRR